MITLSLSHSLTLSLALSHHHSHYTIILIIIQLEDNEADEADDELRDMSGLHEVSHSMDLMIGS